MQTARGYCDDPSVLVHGVRNLFANLRDRLILLGELPKQFPDVLLGVGLGALLPANIVILFAVDVTKVKCI
jgi:hypothetical protein